MSRNWHPDLAGLGLARAGSLPLGVDLIRENCGEGQVLPENSFDTPEKVRAHTKVRAKVSQGQNPEVLKIVLLASSGY
jgi:hypothetical protein